MRRIISFCFLFLSLLMTMPVSAQVQNRSSDPTLNKGEGLTVKKSDLLEKKNHKQDKKSRQVDLYMMAASFSLVDSLLIISDIQKVEDVTVNNKWFLVDRAQYEAQYSEFIGAEFNETLVPVVYFAEKEKRMIKKRETILKRNAKKVHFDVDETPDFRFVKVVHQEPEPEQQD